jgi:hypothetical protein
VALNQVVFQFRREPVLLLASEVAEVGHVVIHEVNKVVVVSKVVTVALSQVAGEQLPGLKIGAALWALDVTAHHSTYELRFFLAGHGDEVFVFIDKIKDDHAPDVVQQEFGSVTFVI